MKIILTIYMTIGIMMALIVTPSFIKQFKNTNMILLIISLIFLIFLWPIGVTGAFYDKKRGKGGFL